jgi:hypothetical protein
MARSNKYLIWWTADWQAQEGVRLLGVPKYIRDEFRDRVGRAGRGRLWVPTSIPIQCMKNPNKAPVACGGIVFLASDLSVVDGLPGFVTDMSGTII